MIKNETHKIHAHHLEMLKNVKSIPEFPSINHLILFGSYAIGCANQLSDIDLAYFTDEEFSLKNELDLMGYFNRIIGSDEIDLVNFYKAPVSLKYKIFDQGKIIFSKNSDEIAALKEKIFPVYVDFSYYQKEYQASLIEKFEGV